MNIKIQHAISRTQTDAPFLVMVEMHKLGDSIYA